MKKTLFSIRESFKISILTFYLCISAIVSSVCQSNTIDYRKVFGERYTDASNYLSQNSWISETIAKQGLDPCFAQSVIFPELIRYSFLQDKLEIQSLFTLYVQYGEDYANFSVGRFQMKPTFAWLVENDVGSEKAIYKDYNQKGIQISNTQQARFERIKRLDDPQWQVQYLIWFLKIAEQKFSKLSWKTTEEKLKFFATAYNCGYNHTTEYINHMAKQSFFHTSLFKNNILYNYADISLYYWQTCKNQFNHQ